MRIRCLFAVAVVVPLLLPACVTTNEADLQEYLQAGRLQVSQNEAPTGAVPIEVISYYRSGFYLCGVLPIVSVELDDAVEWLTERADELGADGIAHLNFQYSPASFWKFTVFPLPDWSSWIHVSGMAYELPDESSGALESTTATVESLTPSN